MPPYPTIVWFRQDLRLEDNPALHAAVERGPIIPVYIWSPEDEAPWAPGAASRYWLHQSLERLGADLAKHRVRLVLRIGPAAKVLDALLEETKAGAVYWNRRYEPNVIERDAAIKKALTGRGIEVKSFNGALLFEPWEIENKSGKPYQVFTQFWKTCLKGSEPAAPLPAPANFTVPERSPETFALADLELEPTIDWAGGIREAWDIGEEAAHTRLEAFLDEAVQDYAAKRNNPDTDGTSRMSPHLHFGEIGPRQIWHAVQRRGTDLGGTTGAEKFLAEVGWREFSHHLLYHFPHTTDAPLRENFAHFPWHDDDEALQSWQRGRTGYPMVDAGMRELWHTGWMHNRVRMITASFLTKDLVLAWQHGAKWFWDTLVDADLANNTQGWQWTAGCGADAAPYFRIFNPVTQGQKFDPNGDYVRRWVPELAALPTKYLHGPWEAPAAVLKDAGITLGETYPKPIVDHKEAREKALAAFEAIKVHA